MCKNAVSFVTEELSLPNKNRTRRIKTKTEVWSNIIQAKKMQDLKAGNHMFNNRVLVRLIECASNETLLAKHVPFIT